MELNGPFGLFPSKPKCHPSKDPGSSIVSGALISQPSQWLKSVSKSVRKKETDFAENSVNITQCGVSILKDVTRIKKPSGKMIFPTSSDIWSLHLDILSHDPDYHPGHA